MDKMDEFLSEDNIISEWEKRRYVPKPGEPELPPQLREMRGKSADEAAAELKKLPFFMTKLDDDEPNEMIEALQALAYEGEPDEVAGNFKAQGNECYQVHKFKDAIEHYTKALNVKCEDNAINSACLLNRAACNLALKNYRKCINDCKLALKIDSKNIKALYRSARAYNAVDRNDEAIECLTYALSLEDSKAMTELKAKCEKRRDDLLELEKKRRAREELKLTKARNLEMAIKAHGFTTMTTQEKGGTGGEELSIKLEDEMDPHSDLLVPVLCLYPLEMESDMIQPQSDQVTIQQTLEMIFESAPEWLSKSSSSTSDYALANLVVFVQTESGGLAKAPKKSSFQKVFSSKAPVLPLIDNTARIYIVPKNRQEEFTKSWNKESAAALLNSAS